MKAIIKIGISNYEEFTALGNLYAVELHEDNLDDDLLKIKSISDQFGLYVLKMKDELINAKNFHIAEIKAKRKTLNIESPEFENFYVDFRLYLFENSTQIVGDLFSELDYQLTNFLVDL